MNGALARVLGLAGSLPNAPASDEASLSDCSNSVEDPDELRAALRVKAELGDEARRLSGGSGGSGSGVMARGMERHNGHHTIGGLDHLLQAVQQQQLQLEHVKQSPSPLPLPPGVSLEPVQKMMIPQPQASGSAASRRTPTPSGSHLSQHLQNSSQSSQSTPNTATLNGFHLPQQQHQPLHPKDTHTPSNHHHPQQQRLHRNAIAQGSQLFANGGPRQRGSAPELSSPAQMNSRTVVNGASTKRRRDFETEQTDSSEPLVEKRSFYKEMIKLCGTVQCLVESMRETQHLKQRVLIEKLRLVRMREAALVAQAQRESIADKDSVRIVPEPNSDGIQETLRAIDGVGEDEAVDEPVDEHPVRTKDGHRDGTGSSSENGPPSAEQQLLPDVEEKIDDFDEDGGRDDKAKHDALAIGILLDEDDENGLETDKKDAEQDMPETEEE
ncbi:hypothetical protein BIW11_01019 [Tropilaelaps mercedesae]|uniref:Uncharacterized protein n=1 Tax=Tropilaelaps mercedesae TaxID=418985 RepID=A0A1V9XKV5_9ACAR|nr:hypothetical protein BIW11_01019 [Tropilaelaps mercedesae]